MASTCAPPPLAFPSSSFLPSPTSPLLVWMDDDLDDSHQFHLQSSLNLAPTPPFPRSSSPPPPFLLADANKENIDPLRPILPHPLALAKPSSLRKPLQDITGSFQPRQASDLRHKLRNGVVATVQKDQGPESRVNSLRVSSGCKKKIVRGGMISSGGDSAVRSQELRTRFR